jgi:hypothetical protein
MKESTRYLEAAKIEELTEELSAKGYEVTRLARGNGALFDLVAEKPGEKIAYEVKAPSSLRSSVERVVEQRKRAAEAGYDSIQLVVVNPPRATTVRIEGIEQAVLDYLDENPPVELEALAERELHKIMAKWKRPPVIISTGVQNLESKTLDAIMTLESGPLPEVAIKPTRVSQIDFTSVEMRRDKVRVQGEGLLDATLIVNLLMSLDGTTSPISTAHVDFPVKFDVVLDRDGRVVWAYQLEVDTSSFDD